MWRHQLLIMNKFIRQNKWQKSHTHTLTHINVINIIIISATTRDIAVFQ